MTDVDRSPKPCAHPRAAHLHGARATYVHDRCRCIPCTDAHLAYERERRREHLYGRWDGLVDAGPARAHVHALGAAGMGWKRVAAAAGVSQGAMAKLLYGQATRGTEPSRRIRPDAATRILAVQLDLADGALLDATGTARRLQALVCAGWSQSKLAARVGVLPANFTAVVYGRGRLTARTVRVVADLYEELWDTAPPQDTPHDRAAVSRARAVADWRGWAPAMAWDEDTIDDPAAVPLAGATVDLVDEVAVARRAAGDQGVELTRAERAALVALLHGHGLNDQQIARRTGIYDGVVRKDRVRLGLPALTGEAVA